MGLLTVQFDNIAQTSRTEVHVLKTSPLDNDLPNSKTDKAACYTNLELLTRLQPLLFQYRDLFQGIGKFKTYEVHLHIDKSVCV